MISVEVKGDTQLIAKLDAMPGRLRDALVARFTRLSLEMVARIKQKLSGEVLNVRSGNLRDSIADDVTATDTQVAGNVFSQPNVKYNRIQEYGGVTSPHVIETKDGGVLAFEMGGGTVFARRVNHPGSRIPPRPFMRPTLQEYRGRIIENVDAAVTESFTG